MITKALELRANVFLQPSERGDAETRGYGNAIMPKHAVERHDHGNIPQMLHWDPETTTQITRLVISQRKLNLS
jgi:hypothetical protein